MTVVVCVCRLGVCAVPEVAVVAVVEVVEVVEAAGLDGALIAADGMRMRLAVGDARRPLR